VNDIDNEVEQALALRQGKRRGAELDFACIAHEDNHPSASWNRKKATWHCLACGAGGGTRDLAERLGIHIEKPEPRQIVATYDYRDETGQLLYQSVRYQPKAFSQRRPDGAGGWIWDLRGVRLVLYRLPELVASIGRVYVVEGEKDVEAIRLHGGIATCNAMGAVESGKSKWYPEYSAFFKGREVVIVPDRDRAGDKHGAFVALSLSGTASSVKQLLLPGLEWREKQGPDVSDWFAVGNTFEELEELANECTPWKVEDTSHHTWPETDSGNAEMFAHLYGDSVRYDWRRERWLVWDRHRWIPDATGELIRLSIKLARERAKQAAELTGERAAKAFGFAKTSESAGKIEAMLKLARAIPPIADSGGGWDSNLLLMGFENGIVNLVTGEIRPGRQEDRITKTTGVVFDPVASCPRWEEFMEEVLPDAQVREFCRLAAGYSMTGITREEVWFLLYGRGANGKSTFIDVLRWAAGEYGDVIAFSTLEKGKDQRPATDLAAIAGRRVITTSETDKGTRFNEARLKLLTGQDPIKARELYKPEFTFQPELKLWVAVNDKPTMRDDSEGNWRRVRLIPFTQSFEGATRDLDLRGRLKAEIQGIAAWMVRAAVDWHKRGLPIPPAVAVATVEYREESNPLAEFITECCVVTELAEVRATPLFRAYLAWAEKRAMGVRETLTATMFGRLMTDRFKKRRDGTGVLYGGIGLFSDGWEKKEPENTDHVGSPYLTHPAFLETFEALPRDAENLPEKHTELYNPTLCSCETICPLGVDADVGCDGSPFWVDENGAHCGQCHPNIKLKEVER